MNYSPFGVIIALYYNGRIFRRLYRWRACHTMSFYLFLVNDFHLSPSHKATRNLGSVPSPIGLVSGLANDEDDQIYFFGCLTFATYTAFIAAAFSYREHILSSATFLDTHCCKVRFFVQFHLCSIVLCERRVNCQRSEYTE